MIKQKPVLLSIITFLLISVGLALPGWWLYRYYNWGIGDISSLGQLVLAILLLPTVFYGFLTTFAAFERSQAKPQLSLRWIAASGGYSESITFAKTKTSGTSNKGHLALINSGNAIALWYLIRLDIPNSLHKRQKIEDLDAWYGAIGQSSNWNFIRTDTETQVTFFSNGQIACYPNYPLSLGYCSILVDQFVNTPEVTPITYTLITESDEPIRGTLHIRII